MKCIINCLDKNVSWIREFFPGTTPYLLKFANKFYLEYLIDYCILNGIREIRIVSDNPSGDVYRVLGDGGKYGVNFSFATSVPESTLAEVISKNRSFCTTDDLLLISGFVWLNYNKEKIKPLLPEPEKVCGRVLNEYCGCYLISQSCLADKKDDILFDHWEDNKNLPEIFIVNSIQKFYEQSMKIVYEQNSWYNLPGYGDRSSFVIGRNVIIPHGCDLNTPAIIGNSVQLSRGCSVGPGVILGDNVLIDEKAVVKNTIIMGNSYVGCYSELSDKIVYRNYVIDPELGIAIDIVDEFILTELVKKGVWRCPFKQRLFALFLLVVMSFPFVLLRPFIRITSTPVECFMNQQRRRKLRLKLYLTPAESFASRYFKKLGLDRYHLLPYVVRGRLRLVGSFILEATEENAVMLQQFPDYAPGIFSYSEYLGSEKDLFQREIDELYYMYHASFKLNIKIIFGIWFRNFMKRF
ncbi:MAG: NDP-sugar synthase [Victivallaceae bacterium]